MPLAPASGDITISLMGDVEDSELLSPCWWWLSCTWEGWADIVDMALESEWDVEVELGGIWS